MNIVDLFTGSNTHIYAASWINIILSLMFAMSLRLYLSRQRKAYFSLTLSLFIVIVKYVLVIAFASASRENSSSAIYVTQILEAGAFIMMNMAIYQLYNPSRRRDLLFYNFLLLSTLVISLTHFLIPQLFSGSPHQIQLLKDVWLDLYMFILVFLSYFLVAPYVGQYIKYQTGLLIFIVMQVAHFINQYLLIQPMEIFSLLENLLPMLYYFILFLILFDRVVELMQAIYHSSITDGLTGLYNRRYFSNRVAQYVHQGIPISVIFGDIDNFKHLNDTEGHQRGDEVWNVARITMEECEAYGICGRYGGEEVVVLVTDPGVDIGALAERIRKKVEDKTGVTISLGWSAHHRGVTAEALIKQADRAMYAAKSTGKNKVVKHSGKVIQS